MWNEYQPDRIQNAPAQNIRQSYTCNGSGVGYVADPGLDHVEFHLTDNQWILRSPLLKMNPYPRHLLSISRLRRLVEVGNPRNELFTSIFHLPDILQLWTGEISPSGSQRMN
jgi:hypothetical protein